MDNPLTAFATLTFVFLAALPGSVWMLANLLSVLDQRPRSLPILRLLLASIAIALLLLITDRAWITPMASAFTVVVALHFLSGLILRKTLGVARYESEPKFASQDPDADQAYFEDRDAPQDLSAPDRPGSQSLRDNTNASESTEAKIPTLGPEPPKT